MTNEALLEALARSGLIADDVLAALRRQIAGGANRLDSRALVQQLIDEGHLTKAQGDRLLGAAPAKPHNATIEVDPDDELEVLDDDDPVGGGTTTFMPRRVAADDLEVLPDDDDDLLPPPPPPKRSAKPDPASLETRAGTEDLGLAPLEDDLLSSPLKRPATAGGSAPRKAESPVPLGKPAKKKKRSTWRNEVAPAAPELANQVDDLLDAEGNTAAAAASERRQRARTAIPSGPRNVWDSPLLLIGGGSLLLLIIIGAVLLFVMRRQTGDQALQIAEEAYKSGSFAQAVAAFDQYLTKFPKHASVSSARVHRGLAEMRAATEGTRDWTKALATAHQVLDQISPEAEFSTAQADLASILPTIAQGLTNQAREKPAATLVEQARDATALVDKFVPANLQPTEQLREIAASLALTERQLDRDKSLGTAISEMQKGIAAGNLGEAYAARRKLLQTYPELAEDTKLIAEMVAAAERERSAVKFVAEERAAETTDAAPSTLASVALTSTAGVAAPIEDADTVMILDAGAAYALDPRSGRPRWRRFVGFDTDYVPQVVKLTSGRGVLIVDAVQQAVLLVDASNGKLRWRQKIDDGVPAAPVVVRDRVLVAGRSGKLWTLELQTGKLLGSIVMPQGLRIAPVVEPRERLYYQVADQANMYVLSAENGECREALYLGHEAESISAPPLLVGRYLVLAVNNGAEDAVLRILLADEDGLQLKQVEQTALRGHVVTTPVVSGRALLVATDRGALYSFELGAPDSGRILTKLAEKPPDDKPPLVPHLAVRGSELWLAGYGLTRYDVQSSRGALSPKWINGEQGVVLHAPAVLGPAIVFVTRGGQTPGATATAVNGVDGSRFWETRLGVPLASAPLVEDQSDKATALTTAGALFEVPAAGLASRKLLDAPSAKEERFVLQPDAPLARLDDGRFVFVPARSNASANIEELLIYDPRAEDGKLRRRKLAEPAAARPVGFAKGLLIPTKIGQVMVLDPDTGRNLAEPFQPVVEAGREVAWTDPTVYADNQALLSDGATKLFRLNVVAEPRPHLEAVATADLATPLVSAAAVAGEFAYVVDAGNRLLSFHLPDLAPAKDWRLDSRAIWGPRPVGGQVWVGTLSGQLTCVSGAGELVWQVPFEAGSIIGTPIESRGAIVAGSSSGGVYRLAPDTGKILSEVRLGQPLSVGPQRWHERLLFGGSDGTLHLVAEPK